MLIEQRRKRIILKQKKSLSVKMRDLENRNTYLKREKANVR